jgi:hypothetical protein
VCLSCLLPFKRLDSRASNPFPAQTPSVKRPRTPEKNPNPDQKKRANTSLKMRASTLEVKEHCAKLPRQADQCLSFGHNDWPL